MEFENSRLASLQIIKTDEYNGTPLSGAIFRVTTQNGQFVADVTTDGSGKAVIPALTPGWYVVSETKAPTGYLITEAARTVEVKAAVPTVVTIYEQSGEQSANRKIGLLHTRSPCRGNHHSAIVSREIYDKAQSAILRFKRPKKTGEAKYILQSKVVCGCCRHVMQIVPRKERAFVCRYTRVDVNAECCKLEIGERELENLLFEIISKQAQIILNNDGLGDTAGLPLKIEEQAEYEKHINILGDDKLSLFERFHLGEISADIFKQKNPL